MKIDVERRASATGRALQSVPRPCQHIAAELQPLLDERTELQELLGDATPAEKEDLNRQIRALNEQIVPKQRRLSACLARLGSPAWPLARGPFTSSHRIVTDVPFRHGQRHPSRPSNRAAIYYPAATSEAGAPLAAGGPFPLAVFGHASRPPVPVCPGTHSAPELDHRQLSTALLHVARWGFVVISPDLSWLTAEPTGVAGRPLLDDAISYMLAASGSASAFRGRLLRTGIGALGHSAGGHSALLVAAASRLPITALGLLAPEDGSAEIGQAGETPLLVLRGTRDVQVSDPKPIFDRALGPKHLVTLDRANHFGYTDSLCVRGDDFPDRLARRDQQLFAMAYLTAFLQRYVRGDRVMDDYLTEVGSRRVPVREVEELERFRVEVESET